MVEIDIVEVLVLDRVGPYHPGQVVSILDGIYLRALVKSGKVEILNPPDWSIYNASARYAIAMGLADFYGVGTVEELEELFIESQKIDYDAIDWSRYGFE